MKLRQTLSTGLVALALTTTTGAGAAMIKGEIGSVRVDVSDLNLTTAEGQNVMKLRVKDAAKHVCGPTSAWDAGSFTESRRNRACVEETLVNATQNADILTAAK